MSELSTHSVLTPAVIHARFLAPLTHAGKDLHTILTDTMLGYGYCSTASRDGALLFCHLLKSMFLNLSAEFARCFVLKFVCLVFFCFS